MLARDVNDVSCPGLATVSRSRLATWTFRSPLNFFIAFVGDRPGGGGGFDGAQACLEDTDDNGGERRKAASVLSSPTGLRAPEFLFRTSIYC